jgi:hypothetical protein
MKCVHHLFCRGAACCARGVNPAALYPAPSSAYEWLSVKCRYRVVENIVHAAINMALAARFPGCDGAPHFLAPLPTRPFDRAHDPVARRRTERNEFPARAFEREAVFVIPARWVRPNAATRMPSSISVVRAIHCSGEP